MSIISLEQQLLAVVKVVRKGLSMLYGGLTMTSTINTDKCSKIELEFEYLDYFLIKISRPFSDRFSGDVYSNVPHYNGELFHLFSLSSYLTIEEVIKYSLQDCDEFLIEYPPESPPDEDRSLDDVPF
jgi:hypothetical protein